jgi:hypothetical protein
MNTKPNLLRPLLATLLKLSRSLHLADLNFTLVGFGLPVCPAQLTGQRSHYHGLMCASPPLPTGRAAQKSFKFKTNQI